jgi:hypothetical protein
MIVTLLMTAAFTINWTSVQASLPLQSGDYLVSNGEAIAVTFFNKFTQRWNETSNLGEGKLLDFWEHDEITHWHPLPLSPKQMGLEKSIENLS